MYELNRDIFDHGRIIPKGTPVSDVREYPDREVECIASVWGQRIKLRIIARDLRIRATPASK